jgi:RNA polymerase sigma-70 factor (ECF subfamily)
LHAAHYGAVRGYALRRADPDTAQEVVAETFVVAWRRLDDVPDEALPWLFGVARRVLANQRRGAARRDALATRMAERSCEPAVGDPLDAVAADSGRVRRALDTLGERDREALMLVAWEGLPADVAARAFGCSRATFAVRLHRARRRLADALDALEQPGPVANDELVEAT